MKPFSTAVAGLVALGWFHSGAVAQDSAPSKTSDPILMLQTICVDHKADFNAVVTFAKATGWVPATTGGFPMGQAFQETASLQSPDTDGHDGLLLYAGTAVFPHQATSSVCMIVVRPGSYGTIRKELEKWMGSAPSKENATKAAYMFQEIDGVRQALPVTLNQASRDAALKKGPVLSVSVAHVSNVTLLMYMVLTAPR